MKRNPLWMSAAIACLIFMALLSIGAGVREVWNPEPQFNKTRSGYSTITNDLRVLPKTRQALVSFVFDEPYTEVYTVIKPIFDTAGIVGCNAVCDSGAYAVGLPGFMSWANLVTLQGSGWEILSHSSTHANLTLLTEAQVTNELTTSKSAIESRGLTVHNFVYPFGQNNEAVRRITRSYYRSGRGVGEGANTNVLSTYNLKIRQIDNPALLETYKSYVDVATTNSQWIIFYGHANLIDGTMLSNLVAFIQLTNVPIVTVNRALDLIGNDIEFGETAMSAEGFTTAKKVGIGERNPVATLEVNGNIYAAGAPSDTTFNGDIANSSVNLIGYSGVWAIRTAVNSSFNIDMLNSGSTPVKALTITKDGTVSAGTNLVTSYKLGIGTATPQSSIDLRGTYTALDGAISKAMVNIISASSAGVDKGGTLQLGGESGNGVTPYTFAAIKGAKESAVAGNYSGYMSFYTVPSASGITERVRITGSGNVGIVHTAPLAKLDVNGGVNIGSVAYDPGASNLRLEGNITVGGNATFSNSIASASYRMFYLPACSFTPSSTNGAAPTTNTVSGSDDMTTDAYAFDDTTAESIQQSWVMPEEWDRGTVKVKFFWLTSASSGDVCWKIAMGSASHDDPLGAILGTAVGVTNTVTAANDQLVTSATAAITVGGTPALGDRLQIKLSRDPSIASDMTGDAILIGVAIQYREGVTHVATW